MADVAALWVHSMTTTPDPVFVIALRLGLTGPEFGELLAYDI